MRSIKNEKGMALIVSLFVVVVLLGLGTVFALRTVNEANMSRRERQLAKAFYISEAGTETGLDAVDNLINNYMFNTVNGMNPSVLINTAQNYVNGDDGIGFLMQTVQYNGTQVLTLNESQAEYTGASVSYGEGSFSYKIVITEKNDPNTVNPDVWDFPFNYRVEATADSSGVSHTAKLHGDFTVRVQRDNFAKYALFTNTQTMPSGTNVWFTNKTNFAGPIHTLNPSGTFEGLVAQHEQTARFYNNGWPVLLDAEANGTTDVPTFNAGFDRGESTITLSSAIVQQDMVDQAQGGQSLSGTGIFVPSSGSALTGGIYVNGDSTVNLSVDADNNAVYTIVQGADTKIVTVDKTNNQTTVNIPSVGTTTYNGIPNGVDDVGTIIYVEGSVTSLSGTVQEGTQMTLATSSDVVITNHLRYASYTPAVGTPGIPGYVPPHAQGADNLLGIVSWNGNVRIGTTAPNDVDVHGTILASSGIFQVDNYNDYGPGPRGTATLLGGVITNNYGAFGLFNGTTGQQLTGYGRNFVYDERMRMGSAPPYFPSLNTFIAFTNDIMDKIVWVEGD